MIDVLAIATNGYQSIERKQFSRAVDGYYPLDAVAVIVPGGGGGGGSIKKFRQDDDDIEDIIKIFMKVWDW